MATTTKTGYCNGSDMLVYVGGKAVGHCTTHTTTMNSETKDRAVKPVATKGISAGLWKGKGVTGLSISNLGRGSGILRRKRNRLQGSGGSMESRQECRGKVYGT